METYVAASAAPHPVSAATAPEPAAAQGRGRLWGGRALHPPELQPAPARPPDGGQSAAARRSRCCPDREERAGPEEGVERDDVLPRPTLGPPPAALRIKAGESQVLNITLILNQIH